MELRSVARCRLRFAVRFTWRGADKRRQRAMGFTRDISGVGLFIIAPACPPAGAALRFDLVLPPLHGKAPIQMQGEGRVLRTESASADFGIWGFAAANESFSLSELVNGSGSVSADPRRNGARSQRG